MKQRIDRVTLTSAGLELMNLGFVVIPSGGQKSNNPAVLGRGWQTVRPTANEFITAMEQPQVTGIGAITTGLAVIDLDMKNGIDGIANFFSFVEEHDPKFKHTVDAAPAAGTPTEGLHLYLGDPNGEVANSAGKIAPGVDVRGVGGFIAMPPTVRPGVGKYEWVQNPRPVSELTPAPDWMKSSVHASTGEYVVGSAIWPFKDTEWGTDRLADFAFGISETKQGGRNEALFLKSRAAGHLLVEGELTYETILTVLTAGAVDAGLSEHEAHATIRSGVLTAIDKRVAACSVLTERLRNGHQR